MAIINNKFFQLLGFRQEQKKENTAKKQGAIARYIRLLSDIPMRGCKLLKTTPSKNAETTAPNPSSRNILDGCSVK